MKHLKTLSATFILLAFCELVEVGNTREVNTSAYLSHWFQGSCYVSANLFLVSLAHWQMKQNIKTQLRCQSWVRYSSVLSFVC